MSGIQRYFGGGKCTMHTPLSLRYIREFDHIQEMDKKTNLHIEEMFNLDTKHELEKAKLNAKIDELDNMLQDVVNELILSDSAIEEHGQLGTPPAELVRLTLEQKDSKEAIYKAREKSHKAKIDELLNDPMTEQEYNKIQAEGLRWLVQKVGRDDAISVKRILELADELESKQ